MSILLGLSVLPAEGDLRPRPGQSALGPDRHAYPGIMGQTAVQARFRRRRAGSGPVPAIGPPNSLTVRMESSYIP